MEYLTFLTLIYIEIYFMKHICVLHMDTINNIKKYNSFNNSKERFFKSFIGKDAKLIHKNWFDEDIEIFVKNPNINAIIIDGSYSNITDKNPPRISKKIYNINKPILALCYGFQYIVNEKLKKKCKNCIGVHNIKNTCYNKLCIKHPFNVKNCNYYFNHYYYIKKIPKNWRNIISKDDQIWMASNDKKKHLFLQFHPESVEETGKIFYDKWLKYIS